MSSIFATEIYFTVQGEGLLQGVPSIILRTPGCNLNCIWCDSDEGSSLKFLCKAEDLFQYMMSLNCTHLIITGGEPMIQKDIKEFTSELCERGIHLTIETNGTVASRVKANLISISPKLKNAENKSKTIDYDVLNYYIKNYPYQLKFVVRTEADFREIKNVLSNLDTYDHDRILAMPLASSKKEIEETGKSVVELCKKYNIRYADRMQLRLWEEELDERKNRWKETVK